MTKLDKLTKPDLLLALEMTNQHFWPPRPTRQDTETLRRAILAATRAGSASTDLPSFIAKRIEAYNDKKVERRLAYIAANKRHPMKMRP